MIQAIIFDCFGVLTSEGWLGFKQKFFGHDADQRQQASDLRKQVDSGRMDYRNFVREIAAMAGIGEAEFRAAIERNAPNDELFDYIEKRLKPHYKLGLLSNAASNRLESLFGAERAALFDEIALSFETGAIKPDERAYEAIAAKLGVRAGDCVFVDDQERHVAGARRAGMHAVLYENFEQFRRDLELLLAAD